MDLTPRKRRKIITLHEHTSLARGEFAEQSEASSGAVSKIIKLKSETGSVSPQRKGRCGLKNKMTFKDDVFLLRESEIDPHKTSFDLQNDLTTAGVQVHEATVCRRLLDFGRKARKQAKKLLLAEVMRKKYSVGARNSKLGLQQIGEKLIFW
jgi:hypothetical protein